VLTVLLQSAVLLILGQVLLGAVGYAVSAWLPWLGLPLSVLLFWLIVRTARVLRGELEEAARKRQAVVPWQMAAWAALMWQWPSVVFLPSGTFAPEWLGRVWNGVMLPVQGTFGTALGPWLWVAVVVETLAFVAIVGRPLTLAMALVVSKPVEQPPAQREVAAAAEWAPARRHKDAIRRRKKA